MGSSGDAMCYQWLPTPCELARAVILAWLQVADALLEWPAILCNETQRQTLERLEDSIMSKTQEDIGGLDRLIELRTKIAGYAPMVDTPADQYAHNIVGITLSMINTEFGTAAANEAIEDFGLEAKGWSKRDIPEGD